MNEFLEFCQQLSKKPRLSINQLTSSAFADKFLEIQSITGASHPRQILYHAISQNFSVPRCICKKQLPWHPDLKTFRQYCSTKCQGTGTIEKRKATNLQNLGVEFPSQQPDFRDKISVTSRLKWGVDHYSKTAEFNQRVANTNMASLGVKRPAQHPDIKEKIKNTMLQTHGVENPMHSELCKQKIKQTCQNKYGVESPMQLDLVKQKVKDTTVNKYGVDHLMKNKTYAQNVGIQRKKNYYEPMVFQQIHDKTWLNDQNLSGKSVVEIADHLGVSASNLCKYYHKHQLPIIKHSLSFVEKQLAQYFLNQGEILTTRDCTIIPPKELDIVFTDAKLAIEINGAYWHSEQFCKDSRYHINKTASAAAAGYELWHFWDWEIHSGWDKLINRISARLGKNTKIAARKLSIHPIDPNEKSEFFNKWHLQNDCTSSVNLGLRDSQGQLLMVASFGTSRFNKKFNWELLRLSSKGNISVVGGASKLIQYFVNHYMNENQQLVSYCNRRWSNGNVYLKSGFQLAGQSDPGYVYVKSGKYAASRYQFQKHKLSQYLEKFDPELSEKQNAEQNGYYRAWDCGNLIFCLTK